MMLPLSSFCYNFSLLITACALCDSCQSCDVTRCTGSSHGAFVRFKRFNVSYAACLIATLQVYGGGVAFVVHPYVWSSNSFDGASSTSSGDTVVSGLSAVFVDCNFSGSSATTRSIGRFCVAHYVHCCCLNCSNASQMLDHR